jgi:hypothetical protein
MYLQIKNPLKLMEKWVYYTHIGTNRDSYDITRLYTGSVSVYFSIFRDSENDNDGLYFRVHISTKSIHEIQSQVYSDYYRIGLTEIKDIYTFNNRLTDIYHAHKFGYTITTTCTLK